MTGLGWNDFLEQLRHGLEQPRVPRQAWREFEPSLAYGRHAGPFSSSARLAAVTILLYPVDDRPYLALTRRQEQLRSHGGQISFPGGSIDAGETASAAALRELEEELGVPAADLEVAGELSPLFIFNSNFVVTPVVVLAPHQPKFTLQDSEVAELLQTPLSQLMAPSSRGLHLVRRGSAVIEAPHLACGGHQIWGATCMILAEFLSLVNNARLR
jgi:8-oxo-dGTP pyrophosphatase MutT (NUDIX family)